MLTLNTLYNVIIVTAHCIYNIKTKIIIIINNNNNNSICKMSHQLSQVNSIKELVAEMGAQDAAEDHIDEDDGIDADDEERFAAVSKAYIDDETRQGYKGANKRLVLWLSEKEPDCINMLTMEELHRVFQEQDGARSIQKMLQ